MEFATFYSDLGCEVTIVEGMDRLLPAMDRELGQNPALILKKRGVKIAVGSLVRDVKQTEPGLAIRYTAREAPGEAEGEAVLCAIGRTPCLNGVFGEGLRPEMNGRSIRVDSNSQISIPHVYAIGDVSSRIQLAHAASAQGTAVADLLCGKENGVNLEIVLCCIYSRPEIAAVGMTEQEAREAQIPAVSGKCVMFGNARTVIMGGDRCFMKLVAHRDDHRILGA